MEEGFNAIGGSATVNDAAYDLTFFKNYGVNPFIDTEDDHLSTFAVDVRYGFLHGGAAPLCRTATSRTPTRYASRSL